MSIVVFRTLSLSIIFLIIPSLSFSAETAQILSRQALQECHKGRMATMRNSRLAHFEGGQMLAERAVALNNQHANGHFALFCTLGEKMRVDGEFLPSIWDFQKLMKALDRTLELDPDHLDALSSKGTFLIRLPRMLGGDPEKGKQILQYVINRDATAINARLELAKISAHEGNHKQALLLARQALQYAKSQHRQDLIPEATKALKDLESSMH